MVTTRKQGLSVSEYDGDDATNTPEDFGGALELEELELRMLDPLNPSPTPNQDSQTSSTTTAFTTPTTDSAASYAKFLKRKRSVGRGPGNKNADIWRFARKRRLSEPERNDHGHSLFYCEHEGCDWKGVSSNAPAHLKLHGHLTGKFAITPAQQVSQMPLLQGFSNQEDKQRESDAARTAMILRNSANKQRFRNNLARLVTQCSLSHQVVVSKPFKDVILSINPEASSCLLKSATSLRPRITRNFELQQYIVIQTIHRGLSCFHISTDTWKTLHGHKHFQAVNIQFVDSDGSLRQVLLDLVEVDSKESKTGAFLGSILIKTMEDYNLHARLGWITSDNVTVNDTLIRTIEAFMVTRGKTYWTEKTRRLRCIGHIINLATQAFMFSASAEAAEIAYQRAELSQLSDAESFVSTEIDERGLCKQPALQKLYKLVVGLRDPKWWQIYKDNARIFPEIGTTAVPKIPGETRWNGWLLMIEEAIRAKPVLDALFTRYKDELEPMILTEVDWSLLHHVCVFLSPFKEVTLKNEGHSTTLDVFQPSMEFLIEHFESSQRLHTRREVLLAPINTAWLLFNKYYQLIDDSGAYITALLLHPQRRLKWLKKRWTTAEKKRWLAAAQKRARDLWLSYKQRFQLEVETAAAPSTELSAFEKWQEEQDVVSDEDDDFTLFINAAPIKLPFVDGKQMTVLQWWSQPLQLQQYPALARLAIDVLSAFAMSAESERTFSKARRTTSWERSQLDGETIRHSELSKDWQSTGIADVTADETTVSDDDDGNEL